MKFKLGFSIMAVAVFASALFAQKGIDTQTQKIKDTATPSTSRETDATRSFDWGKGKTKVRAFLANPYKLASRRDVLIDAVRDTIEEKRMIIDEASSRMADGVIITQPFVFAKGPVLAQSELSRYGVLQYGDNAWSQARMVLVIEVQSIDGIQNNVAVNAKVEGRSVGGGLTPEWISVPSSGLAEDDFLKVLVEKVTGVSVDPVQDVEKTDKP